MLKSPKIVISRERGLPLHSRVANIFVNIAVNKSILPNGGLYIMPTVVYLLPGFSILNHTSSLTVVHLVCISSTCTYGLSSSLIYTSIPPPFFGFLLGQMDVLSYG